MPKQTGTHPTAAQYTQALQNPSRNLGDTELKTGTLDIAAFNMPKAISGNFASVFSVTAQSGKRFAIKCFTRESQSQQERFQAIHNALKVINEPWKVGFDYIPRGVLIDGVWWPILKMEWVAGGRTLIPWLEAHLDNPKLIARVAEQFALAVLGLNSMKASHGDLQHGNLLIDSADNLRLIDYDGMYIPSVARLGGTEIGHVNYQSPVRDLKDFGPELDHFSAWVVYGSLVALAIDARLWSELRRDGEEQLLFGAKDYRLQTDRAVDALSRGAQPLGSISSLISRAISSATLGSIPRFAPALAALPPHLRSGLLPAEQIILQPSVGSATQARVIPAVPQSDWWKEHKEPGVALRPPLPSGTASSSSSPSSAMSTNVAAAGPPINVAKLEYGGPIVVIRCALILSVVAVVGFVMLTLTNTLLPTAGITGIGIGVALALAVLAVGWRGEPARVSAKAARTADIRCREELHAAEMPLAKVRSRIETLERDVAGAGASDHAKMVHLSAAEHTALGVLANDAARLTKAVAAQRRSLAQRADLEQSQRLKAIQSAHVSSYLAQKKIRNAGLPGLGPALLEALRAAGFESAADLARIEVASSTGAYGTLTAEFAKPGGQLVRVAGIGPVKANSLETWRNRVKAEALKTQPSGLAPDALRAIRSKTTAEDSRLAQRPAEIARDADQKSVKIRSQFVASRSAARMESSRLAASNASERTRLLVELQAHAYFVEPFRLRQSRSEAEAAAAEEVSFRRYVGRVIGIISK